MIKISTNQLMKNIINKIDINEHYDLSEILPLFEPRLVINNDYVVFATPKGYTKEFIDSWGNDFAGFEGNVNDFHVDQNLDINIPDMEERINHGIPHGLFQKSIIACEEVFKMFNNYPEIKPEDAFTIIFSIDSFDPEIDSEDEEIIEVSSSLRFTKKRNLSSWVSDDLEVYKQPIMTVDFDKKSISSIPEKWWVKYSN